MMVIPVNTANHILSGNFDETFKLKAYNDLDEDLGWEIYLDNPNSIDGFFYLDNINTILNQTLLNMSYFGLIANNILIAKLQLDTPETLITNSTLKINLYRKIVIDSSNYVYYFNPETVNYILVAGDVAVEEIVIATYDFNPSAINYLLLVGEIDATNSA